MKKTMLATAIIALISAPLAQAEGYYHHEHKRPHHKDGWARVLDVREVYKETVERVPVEQCSVHHSSYRSSSHGGSATPAIVGGIIGGAVGNSLGNHKSSQKVGAVVGAVLGASIGHDIGGAHGISSRHGHRDYHTSERCDTYYEERVHRYVVGYDVDYRYRGRVYTTHRKHHPGGHIKIHDEWGDGHHKWKNHRKYDHWH